MKVVSPSFAAMDIARHRGPRAGLVIADRVLADGVSRSTFSAIAAGLAKYPGVSWAAWVADHADGRAESPLESLGRWAFLQAGRPAPLSNVWVGAGRTHFRVDHLLPESGVILEGDGDQKYRQDNAVELIR